MSDQPPNPVLAAVSLLGTLQAQCTYWQGILGLTNWHVHVYPVPANHPKLGDCLASCEMFEQRQDAIIRVVRPADLPSVAHNFLDGEEADYDLTLVHELLHLHFNTFAVPDGDPKGVAQEQAINAISRGLVKLYREDQPQGANPTCQHHVPPGIEGVGEPQALAQEPQPPPPGMVGHYL